MSNYRNDLAYVCQRNLNHSTSFCQTVLIKQQGINLLDQNHLLFSWFYGIHFNDYFHTLNFKCIQNLS